MSQRTLLITGASGFIGSALVRQLLLGKKFCLRAALRTKKTGLPEGLDFVLVGDMTAATDWSKALHEVEAVVHLAARAHVMRETAEDPLSEFRRVNVDGTLALARQAAKAGVRRFVFVSSIGVNGNESGAKPFTEADVPNPQDDYAISKLEAENALRNLFKGSATDLVIVRPPLVYGPNAPGNFGRFRRLIQRGFPLPLGAIHNKRSLIAMDNLVDLITLCLDSSAAANQTFLVSDGEDLSTPELIRRMANAMRRPARLIPVPAWLIISGTRLLGMSRMAVRLCGSLQVDSRKARELLGWSPPITVNEGLSRAVASPDQRR